MRNVLFVAYRFPPYGGPPVQRPAKFAKYLPAFGYRPLVLTTADHEPRMAYDPGLLAELGEVTIYPCRGDERWMIRWPRKLRLSPLLACSLRPDNGILAWGPAAFRAALRIARRHRIHAIYTTSPPFSSAILGQWLKARLGVPWVVDYRDPWTDDIMGIWPSRLHYRWEAAQERRVLASTDAVVVATPTMRELMVHRYPRLAGRIHAICNGFDPEDLAAAAAGAAEPAGPPKLRIGFTGNLFNHDSDREIWKPYGLLGRWMSRVGYRLTAIDHATHSPYYLLQAVRGLLDECPELRDRIALTFAGSFGEKNRELVRQLKLSDMVSLPGFLPHAQSVPLMQSDVLFLPILSGRDGRRGYIHSAKTFEYLATGKPILAAAGPGDCRDLIEQARAGWCVDPRDVVAIKALLRRLVQEKFAGTLGIDPHCEFIGRFDRRRLMGQLAALFDRLR